MNEETEGACVTSISAKVRSMWGEGRLTLFCCFISSGAFLDIFYTNYSFKFAAECAESENSVPPPWLLFTLLLLLPAVVSTIFGRNLPYKIACIGLWLFYSYWAIIIVIEDFSPAYGINCYRDVGLGITIVFGFTLLFLAAIFAITAFFGATVLIRRLLGHSRAT